MRKPLKKKDGLTLFYIFKQESKPPVLILVRELEREEKAVSIAETFPSASWFEREVRDGFGLEFTGAFDTRRLFLHECYPEGSILCKKLSKTGQSRRLKPHVLSTGSGRSKVKVCTRFL